MNVNVNKEQLIKHHFWILSGCYLLAVLIPLVLLWSGVSGTITKERSELDNTKKTVSGFTNPKNQLHVDAWKKTDGYVERKKDEVWKQAWELQKDMMIWPENLQETFSQRYRYMGDPISGDDAYRYSREYTTQFKELYELVDPVRSRENGAVQFRGGNTQEAMVELLGLKHDFGTLPTKDDIWLAQEDLWVKRELLAIVRDANDSVALFKEVKPDAEAGKSKPGTEAAEANSKKAEAGVAEEKKTEAAEAKVKKEPQPAAPPPASDPNHKIFRNPYWQMELTLTRSSGGKSSFQLSGKITNISDHKLACGNVYRIYMDEGSGSGYALLPSDREPLAAGESFEFSNVDVPPTVQVRGLYGVEQIWNWRTAPVKRIDDVRLCYNSSRTASIYRLDKWEKPSWYKSDKPEQEGVGDTSAGNAPGDISGGVAGMTQKFMGSMAGMGTNAGQGESTKHGLPLVRYSDANEQVRHMPVAMVVVMDEANIPDLLAAVDNSKLRIQLLQFHWHHLRDVKIQPPAQESPAEGTPQPGITTRLPAMAGPGPGGPGPAGMMKQMGQMNRKMGGMMGMGSMMGGPMMGMTRQGAGTGGTGFLGQRALGPGLAGTPGTEDEEETEMNLVEVAVYGLASLYERHPPKPATTPAEQK